jgi:hypothetical protein
MRSTRARSGARRRRTGRDAARVPEPAGFIRYGLADAGDKTCVSLSLWETRKDADAATRLSETWDREHAADRVELRTNQVGDLAFYKGVPARV